MHKSIRDRVKALEEATGSHLPPIFHLDGSESSSRGWQPGTTRETAESANESMKLLRECLKMDDGSWDDSAYIIAMRDRETNKILLEDKKNDTV